MARTVEVPEYAIQPAVELSSRTTAVVVVDMQNDFVTAGGALVVADAAGTVSVIADLVWRARAAKAKVFYTQDSHTPGDPEFPIWASTSWRERGGGRSSTRFRRRPVTGLFESFATMVSSALRWITSCG